MKPVSRGMWQLHYASFLHVPLSSLDQESEAIGERAEKLALKLIESKISLRPQAVLLPPKLIARASSLRSG